MLIDYLKKRKVNNFKARLEKKELEGVTISLAEFNKKAIEAKNKFIKESKVNPELKDEFVMRIVEEQLREFKDIVKRSKKVKKMDPPARKDISFKLHELFKELRKLVLDYGVVLNNQYGALQKNDYETFSEKVEKEKELSKKASSQLILLDMELKKVEALMQQKKYQLIAKDSKFLAKELVYGCAALIDCAFTGGYYILKYGIKTAGILAIIGIIVGFFYLIGLKGFLIILAAFGPMLAICVHADYTPGF